MSFFAASEFGWDLRRIYDESLLSLILLMNQKSFNENGTVFSLLMRERIKDGNVISE